MRSLGLTGGKEKTTLDQLSDWQTKGTYIFDLFLLTSWLKHLVLSCNNLGTLHIFKYLFKKQTVLHA